MLSQFCISAIPRGIFYHVLITMSYMYRIQSKKSLDNESLGHFRVGNENPVLTKIQSKLSGIKDKNNKAD